MAQRSIVSELYRENNSISDLIAKNKISKDKALSLVNIDEMLTDFPMEVLELEHLEELTLGYHIDIDNIPDAIVKLNQLRRFEFHSNGIMDFPEVLTQLPRLQSLSIHSATLSTIPAALNSWVNLTYLNLGQCSELKNIEGLPPRLTYLYLNGKRLLQIPKLVFQLSHLSKIVLTDFDLKIFPTEICRFKKLAALFLLNSKIKSIPKDISKLTNLTDLWISGNNLSTFPQAICTLPNLAVLDLRNNLLKTIPDEISKLKNLTELDIGANKFDKIPSGIFKLKRLTRLSVANTLQKRKTAKNTITEIPFEILNLKELTEFEFHFNTIQNIPKEILKDDLGAILNFLRSKIEADREEYLLEAKMVIVGRGDVGKTVLTKKLINPEFTFTSSETTKGINILKNPFLFPIKLANGVKDFRLNIWDFGGQEKYDATHQLFITNRSIYLFLTEARAESNYQDVLYWLNTINLLSSESPVIVVLSKFDERKKLLPESIYRERFKNILDFVDVSCMPGFEFTLQALRNAISSAILQLPQINLTLSNHWVAIRNELESLSLTTDYVSYERYLEICKRNKLDQTRADFLSEYLNDLGVIIHRKNDMLLRKTVFLNTDWCVDGMYQVLDDEIVYNNRGKFSDEQLVAIWNDSRFTKKQPELLKLMLDYSLCFELSDKTGYLAPDLLPPDRPDEINWQYLSSLQFEYVYSFMPAGVLSRFIVKSHSFIKKDLYWKYGVILKHEDSEALIEEDYIRGKIKISVKGTDRKSLLSAIRMFMGQVHKDFTKNGYLDFQEMVPCNCKECQNSSTPKFFKFQVLQIFEKKGITKTHCETGEEVTVKSLISDVEIVNKVDSFTRNSDLRDYLSELIEGVLQEEITLKEGYLNFYRDKECRIAKTEVEVHPYICNTLNSYCIMRGVNLAREVREANGSVDVIFSVTNKDGKLLKTCVEIKKANHQDLLTGIDGQLTSYMKSAGTTSGIYLVLWQKNENIIEPKRYKSVDQMETAILAENPSPENILIKTLICVKPVAPSRIKRR